MSKQRQSSYDFPLEKPRAQSASKTSRVSTDESDLQRLAVNASAVPGSFYDAVTDHIPATLPLENTPVVKRSVSKIIQCQWIRSNGFDRDSFLRDMGIDDDLWLNVTFSVDPVQGIASIVTYSFPTSDNIRFFYHHYEHAENYISKDHHVVMSHVRRDPPQCIATHIVSGIKTGIQVFAVLELPRDHTAELDLFIEQCCATLTVNRQHKTDKEHERWLNQIIVIEVFSNIPALTAMKSLDEIWKSIIGMQTKVVQHPLMAYHLRPIAWFYPSYPSRKSTYLPLEEQTAATIREYVRRMTSDLSHLRHLCDLVLSRSLKRQYERRLEEINAIYRAETDQLREQTLAYRRGRQNQEILHNLLLALQRSSLKSKIDQTVADLSPAQPPISSKGSLSTSSSHDQPVPLQPLASAKKSRGPMKRITPVPEIPSPREDIGGQQQWSTPGAIPSGMLPTYKPASHVTLKVVDSVSSRNTPNADHYSSSSKAQEQLSQSSRNGRSSSRPASPKLSETTRAQTSSSTSKPSSRQLHKPASPPKSMSLESEAKLDAEKLLDSTLPTMSAERRPRFGTRDHSTIESKTQPLISSLDKNNPWKPPEKPIHGPGSAVRTSVTLLSLPKHEQGVPEEQDHTMKPSPPKTCTDHQPSLIYTNILLLGESGVGKSTFINAVANYLAFDSLDRACDSPPFVLIPVSFLITVGHHFDEKLVKLGEEDPNEDHRHHPGRSVTQQCRSYVFPYKADRHVRIIDTPGMSDTRGLDQDDRNMQHILSYINHLPHLDAICILLKPNESRLNVVLRSYFNRLLTFLGPEVGQNVVFCFTDSRSTFFAPGDTGPLLRAMIKKLPTENIAFAKTNTFCFDSESFLYLMALQDQINFDAFEKQEYQKSWAASTTESLRFLQHTCETLKPFPQNRWRSIEHFQNIIRQMARPLLESMRHLYRNIIIQGAKKTQLYLELQSKPLPQVASICYSCKRIPEKIFDIWILSDKCDKCACEAKNRLSIDYRLIFELTSTTDRSVMNNFVSDADRLKAIVLSLAQFQGSLKTRDPVLAYLKRVIAEEELICTEKDSNCLNPMLYDKLTTLEQQYQEQRRLSKSEPVAFDLERPYQLLQNACEINIVDRQMKSAQQTSDAVMKQYEKQVEYNHTDRY